MSERSRLNVTTRDLDVLRRVIDAQRELRIVADELWFERTSKRERRKQLAARLNAAAASLHTVELTLTDER